MTAPQVRVAVDSRPSCDVATPDPSPGVAIFDTTRSYFPAPRGRVVATRPPADAPTLVDVIADYMAAEWGGE